ncbi:MAG: citramalate synthase [Dehalococcoidia bacterium]
MQTDVQLYDTTLRDGAQREGISFSVEDKIKITKKLDELGIHLIEGGWPGSSPKDTEFFSQARDIALSNSTLVAFGSTRHAHTNVENDSNIHGLVNANFGIVTLVGKGSAEQVTNVLKIDRDENLAMIEDSVRYLKSKGITVFFDAEHFFDGYKKDPEYAFRTIEVAADGGADCLVLCDTNGGTMPGEVSAIVDRVKNRVNSPLGIHAHNDMELAVANTLAAVQAGVSQVQGTINGYGERCGNANLCSIIPTLKLKMGIDCVRSEQLAKLTDVSHYVSEIANLALDSHLPYVGASAFGHKGGMHIAAMTRAEDSYQHIDPSLVGNSNRFVVSELSGVNTITHKAREMGLDLAAGNAQTRQILKQLKDLENQGFKYDDADASFNLMLHRAQPHYTSPFELVDFMVVVENNRRLPTINDGEMLCEAMVKVRISQNVYHTAAEGNGPVNALDKALRKALIQFYPKLSVIKLTDYKVRILEETEGTEAKVRVLIESTDGEREWHTVGASTNIIEASWIALADSMEYWLLQNTKTES